MCTMTLIVHNLVYIKQCLLLALGLEVFLCIFRFNIVLATDSKCSCAREPPCRCDGIVLSLKLESSVSQITRRRRSLMQW